MEENTYKSGNKKRTRAEIRKKIEKEENKE
jgi:hypothetical protein